jgi:hypothetical protein
MNQAAIGAAVNRGVSYLRQAQNPVGSWGAGTNVGSGGGWAVGYTALAGLALVECGVPTDDPGLRRAAGLVRQVYGKIDSTYEVALAILFLDRMGDPKDKALIQGLAVRLVVGQTGTGGWAYKVPLVAPTETNQILAALRKLHPPSLPTGFSLRDRPSALGLCIKVADDVRPRPVPVGKATTTPDDPEKTRAAALAALRPGVRQLPVFQPVEQFLAADPEKKASDPVGGTTDNSNTHFATLGLWAARRHDVPTDRSFALLARRFRTSAGPGGGWGYHYAKGGGGGAHPMTCVALLGLAVGHVLAVDPGAGPRPEQDPVIVNAFGLLSKRVGAPTGTADNRPTPKAVGGLYYLWALERIAVLYDVATLDKKDWYQWGAEILVCHQQADGSWADGGYHGQHPVLNTALAVMFLTRANLTPDLSRRLVVDSAVLTAKTATPAPTPEPVVAPAPAPTVVPAVELPVARTETPVKAAPPVQARSTTEDAAPAEKSSDTWLLLIAGVVLVIVAGCVGAYVVFRPTGDESDDEEERPRKGKGRARSVKRAGGK